MLFYFSTEQASAILQTENCVTKIGLATVLPVLLSPMAKLRRNRCKTSFLFSLLPDSHSLHLGLSISKPVLILGCIWFYQMWGLSAATLLPHYPSYLADFLVSVGGNKAQNIAQDPTSTQVHFWLFTSLTDCIRELQNKAYLHVGHIYILLFNTSSWFAMYLSHLEAE